VESTLVRFINALRNAGLPVSSDETLVAAESIKLLGFDDRQQLKSALSLVLAKTEEHKRLFNDCFDRFYSARPTSPSSAAPATPDSNSTSPEPPPELTPELQQMVDASPAELELAIQRAGDNAGVENIRLFTQKGVFLRRILEQLEWSALQDAMLSAARASPNGGPRLSGLQDFAAQLQGAARDYVEQQYALHGAARSMQMRDQMLMHTRINRLDPSQIAHCRKLVNRIVKRLIKHFKRRKRFYRRGMLDLHATLRHNMSTDGALFKLYWRRKHRDRPRVFIICDVSGSVRQYAEIMLLFVYSMQEVLPRAQCYAFSNRLEDVSALLKTRGDVEQAIATTLHRIGGGATDYAAALESFAREAGPALNRNSVIIVLGDARNNGADPALDTFRRCTGKAGNTYWLNPESHFIWNTGDSVMDQYASYCDGLFEVGTLAQLQRFCEYLLRKTQ
jgi:uncharacterized protein with von Willebrand factor type A (vWA) domain